MVNLLVSIAITGIAVPYVVEFLGLLSFDYFGTNLGQKYLTLPLSFGGLYSLGYWNKQLIVATPAATFVAVVIIKWLNKPVATPQAPRRRLPQMPTLP
jgi:hypothetical protein